MVVGNDVPTVICFGAIMVNLALSALTAMILPNF
jgi:hypothetical protein